MIELNSEEVVSYGNRAECRLHLEEWDEARKDFAIVQNRGYDIVSAFYNDYKGGIEEFENKTGIELPEDIAALLTP